ncbi:MAG: beta-ketoacyl synthase N-terminal-like domain-containing protein [Nitrospirota bacterium]
MRRVVVTGMGAVSPLGNTLRETWEAALAGRSGIGALSRCDPGRGPWRAAGELKGFDAAGFLPPKDRRRLDPFIQYAYAAAAMAVEDAGLGGALREDASVLIGSGRGGISTLSASAGRRPSAYLMLGTTVSMAASYVAGRLGLKGHVLGISNACASGGAALGEAVRLVRSGAAGMALAGGAEAPLCTLCIGGYGALGALSREGVSRPFDRGRDGFVLGEGAGVLVLEEYEAAVRRGARPYAEIAGCGNAADAFHPTVPRSDGQIRAMRAALAEAGLSPGDVGCIYAHATSTPAGDSTEAESIGRLFGPGARVTAAKSMTGHMLGASGAVEAALAAMSLREGLLPGILNLGDPEGSLDYVRETVRTEAGAALANSFGFGWLITFLVLRKVGQ